MTSSSKEAKGQFPSRQIPEGKYSRKYMNVVLLRQVNFKSLEAPQSKKG